MELSSKPLLGKDRAQGAETDGDYMRGGGLHDPGKNPNAYPMTDAYTRPSQVEVVINGRAAGWHALPDDPADHRGVLSWHSQLRDRKLREAGTYGYLVTVPLSPEMLAAARAAGRFHIRLQTGAGVPGGLAVYGASSGRYPLDPSLIFSVR
jgi:predicted transcriptional regulator